MNEDFRRGYDAVLEALRNPDERMIEVMLGTPGMAAVDAQVRFQAIRGYPLPKESIKDGFPLHQGLRAAADWLSENYPSMD